MAGRPWLGPDLPPVLQAIVALDAWNEIAVLQHAPWLGRLLAAAILREGGVTTGTHLAAINLGLKAIPVDRRRHRDSETRLLAIAWALTVAAETGLKEHDRLVLARQMMMRKLEGRANVIQAAGARRACHGAAADLRRHGSGDACGHAAGSAPDRSGIGVEGDDGQGRFRAWGII